VSVQKYICLFKLQSPVSERATMSGLFIEIIDLSSSNFFDRESTLLYQHLSDLQLKVVDAPLL